MKCQCHFFLTQSVDFRTHFFEKFTMKRTRDWTLLSYVGSRLMGVNTLILDGIIKLKIFFLFFRIIGEHFTISY